jgi:DNA-binding transcriptional LysR family regulator
MEHLSLDVLRTFLSIADLNGFNKAAEKVHLSQSAISMQMKRLEKQTGQTLFERKGKQRVLTHHGEILLSHARKMIQLNDEILLTLKEHRLKGKARMGIQLDFADSLLLSAIYRYTRHHPDVILDLRVDSSDTLQEMLTKRKLDIILYLAREKNRTFDTITMEAHPLEWVSAPGFSIQPFDKSPLPLVVLGPNCKIRQSVSAALTAAGIPWRIAFASSSLSAAWGAVSAGIGVSARTRIGTPSSLKPVPKSTGLPPLPKVHAYLCTAPGENSRPITSLKEFLLR